MVNFIFLVVCLNNNSWRQNKRNLCDKDTLAVLDKFLARFKGEFQGMLELFPTKLSLLNCLINLLNMFKNVCVHCKTFSDISLTTYWIYLIIETSRHANQLDIWNGMSYPGNRHPLTPNPMWGMASLSNSSTIPEVPNM